MCPEKRAIIHRYVSTMQSLPVLRTQPATVDPSMDKMDIPYLQRDIPKWGKWLQEDSVEEWGMFLKEPLPPPSRRWMLPILLANSHVNVTKQPRAESILPMIASTSSVSSVIYKLNTPRITHCHTTDPINYVPSLECLWVTIR